MVINNGNPIRLIVGLGNPGKEYVRTRHNVGFWLLDSILELYNCNLKLNKKVFGYIDSFHIDLQQVYFLKPDTYMNESGLSVQACAKFFNIKLQEILILHDDLDLSVGVIKLKFAGGHGGHNGLRSIINHLGGENFWRIRIGIDHPKNKNLVSNYVLSAPNNDDIVKITESCHKVLSEIKNIVTGMQQKTMLTLHSNMQNKEQ